MTNDLDNARVKEALNLWDGKIMEQFGLITARLAREGWTPPVPVDPDMVVAELIAREVYASDKPSFCDAARRGIKRGRELERAEAKPGMVWVKHDGSHVDPVGKNDWVWIKSYGQAPYLSLAGSIYWANVTHYAVITQPGGVA